MPEEQALPFLEKEQWTMAEALTWALQRIRISLDVGEYYAKAEAALGEHRELEQLVELPADVVTAMRQAVERLRDGGTFPIKGETWTALKAALEKHAPEPATDQPRVGVGVEGIE